MTEKLKTVLHLKKEHVENEVEFIDLVEDMIHNEFYKKIIDNKLELTDDDIKLTLEFNIKKL